MTSVRSVAKSPDINRLEYNTPESTDYALRNSSTLERDLVLGSTVVRDGAGCWRHAGELMLMKFVDDLRVRNKLP